MKTSAIEVHDMLSIFSVDEVETRIGEVPGVESVTVNFAAGSATVRYDETRLDVADIKSMVRQRGFERDAPAAASGRDGHEGYGAMDTMPTTRAPAVPITSAVAPAAADSKPPDKAATSTAPDPSPAEPVGAPTASAGADPKDKAMPEKS